MSLDTSIIPSTKAAPQSWGRVLVLGLGKSGEVAARYVAHLLGDRVDEVVVLAGPTTERSQRVGADLTRAGARVYFDTEEVPGTFDVAIVSPGISEFSPFYQAARAACSEVISEVEFAWRESARDSVWIAITGTNGKTTTTALTAHIMEQTGRSVRAVGNIGDTCLEAVWQGVTDIYVAEVSSYQLASTRYFAPDAAVMLNITPDHISWHQSFERYVEAKCKLFEHMTRERSVVVFDATNATTRSIYRDLRKSDTHGLTLVPVGNKSGLTGDMRKSCGSDCAAYLRADDKHLVVALGEETYDLCGADELLIPGMHNINNALCAAAACIAAGARIAETRAGLTSFSSLEHRIEACGSIGSVRCYNDSKATNVDATLKALAAFDPARPIVLLGGDDKGTDLTELVQQAEKHCKAVVCFGAAAERFYTAFTSQRSLLNVCRAHGLEQALDVALGMAEADDIVLLSPACASFDEFTSFEHRGRSFKHWVALRQEGKVSAKNAHALDNTNKGFQQTT